LACLQLNKKNTNMGGFLVETTTKAPIVEMVWKRLGEDTSGIVDW
jgi:hypothetical protein